MHNRMMAAQRAEGQEPTGEMSVTLFVRGEAAGVVIGKQGWQLGRVRCWGEKRAWGLGLQFFEQETGVLENIRCYDSLSVVNREVEVL